MTKVNTIQQCSYCFDLTHVNDLSAERLAVCFVHKFYMERQVIFVCSSFLFFHLFELESCLPFG
jgi:hypothetical protein